MRLLRVCGDDSSHGGSTFAGKGVFVVNMQVFVGISLHGLLRGFASEGACPAGEGREGEVSYSPRKRRSSASNSARRDSAAKRAARSSSARA